MPYFNSSALPPSLLAQRRIMVSVASGWNCVQKLRRSRHACGPTALLAISSAGGGPGAAAEPPRLRTDRAPRDLVGGRWHGDDVVVPLHPRPLGDHLGQITDHRMPTDLGFTRPFHRAPERVRHDLIAVADSEDRYAAFVRVAGQRCFGSHGVGDVRPVDTPL